MADCALDLLLAGDNYILDELRNQRTRILTTALEVTGRGFFVYYTMASDVKPITSPCHFELGDVIAGIKGLEYGMGFILFVRNGYMKMLEGYTYEENFTNAENVKYITYSHGKDRDMMSIVKLFETDDHPPRQRLP